MTGIAGSRRSEQERALAGIAARQANEDATRLAREQAQYAADAPVRAAQVRAASAITVQDMKNASKTQEFANELAVVGQRIAADVNIAGMNNEAKAAMQSEMITARGLELLQQGNTALGVALIQAGRGTQNVSTTTGIDPLTGLQRESTTTSGRPADTGLIERGVELGQTPVAPPAPTDGGDMNGDGRVSPEEDEYNRSVTYFEQAKDSLPPAQRDQLKARIAELKAIIIPKG
jgi:hypothetical protein